MGLRPIAVSLGLVSTCLAPAAWATSPAGEENGAGTEESWAPEPPSSPFELQQPDPTHLRAGISLIYPIRPSPRMGIGADGVVGLGLLQRRGPWLLVPHGSFSVHAYKATAHDQEPDVAWLGGLGLTAVYRLDRDGDFGVGFEERILLGSERQSLAGGIRSGLQLRIFAHGVVVLEAAHQALFNRDEPSYGDVRASFGFDIMQFLTAIEFDGKM